MNSNNYKRISLLGFIFIFSGKIFAQLPTYHIQNSGINSGYFLFTPTETQGMAPTGHYLIMMDYTGHIVYYYQGIGNPISYPANFQIQKSKFISFYGNGKYFLADSNFNIADTLSPFNGHVANAHDMQSLSNGNYMMLTNEQVTMDLSGFNMFHHNQSPGSANANVTCGALQEMNLNGQLIWQWRARDHFPFDDAYEFWLYDSTNVDWTHFNAVEEDFDGNILVSSRFFNEIFKINKTTGDVMWRLGGKHNQFTFINDSINFTGQHDIRVLPDSNYSLFDNGYYFPTHKAKAEIFKLDTALHTANFIRKVYGVNQGFSGSRGNAQFMNDGNVLIDWGQMSNDNLVFSITDSNNAEIYRLWFDDSLTSYRTHYYDQLPWNLNQPVISCFDSSGLLVLKAPGGYSEYLWSSGETTSTIISTMPDTVWVYVQKGNLGGMLSSSMEVIDSTSLCGTISDTVLPTSFQYNLYPNPAGDEIILYAPGLVQIEIFNTLGKKVYEEFFEDKFNHRHITLSHLPEGVFILRVTTTNEPINIPFVHQ
ncbi:MAG: aryl-sulfate sulfotransferase [Bacteroidota bacterium]